MEQQWRLMEVYHDNDAYTPNSSHIEVGDWVTWKDKHWMVADIQHPDYINMCESVKLERADGGMLQATVRIKPIDLGNYVTVLDNRMWSVAIYEQDKAFGGREEGGWYYDIGALVMEGSIYNSVGMTPAWFTSRKDALEYRDKMAEAIEKSTINVGNYEPSSVLCRGWYGAELHEDEMPVHYPKVRPHYE
jgi:hypothetical protein